FARDVMPLLVKQVPDVRVRIVGRGRRQVEWVGDVDGIDLVGSVDSVEPELRSADAVIVPIRVGAGTRLKVVEALANRLPLVTTSIGGEGIDLTDGLDALIADDASAFAAACARVLTDGQLRQRLADRGAELFEARYDWDRIESDIADLARQVADEHD
ncbi:MAG: glycosyltransferase, partial [Microthrixaceae bacterium]